MFIIWIHLQQNLYLIGDKNLLTKNELKIDRKKTKSLHECILGLIVNDDIIKKEAKFDDVELVYLFATEKHGKYK